MSKIPAWLAEKLLAAVEPRFGGEHHRDPEAPICQSWRTTSAWKGWSCGNDAKFTVGGEVCCYAHIGQAVGRNPDAVPVPLKGKTA